ncbi:MAG: hypothetical protein IJN39_02685 [Clostridia bacterium]|nr:hypothetical protein [Clostridia bacterium]
MKINKIGNISGGQDGAIFGDYIFRFGTFGKCYVHKLNNFSEKIAEFMLDKSDEIVPHSNAVQFGCEYFEEGDEFPLLYTNIYNNYAKAENPMKGVCLAYRVMKDGDGFTTKLVQKITVDFVEDSLWKSGDDVRPYGNFVIDKDQKRLYAFVMRDEDKVCRYFAFNLPAISDSEAVLLKKEDVIEYFDCPYHYYIQGATCHKGKIYSTEGFRNSKENAPAIRIIDLAEKKQIFHVNIMDMGYIEEPEFIDFDENGTCYYSDANGTFYTFEP